MFSTLFFLAKKVSLWLSLSELTEIAGKNKPASYKKYLIIAIAEKNQSIDESS